MPPSTRQRLNITLPNDTVRLLDHVAAKGDRSRLVDEAVRYFVKTKGRANLRKLLRDGARKHADRDLMLAEEWFALDNGS